MRTAIVIPALNEETSVASVVAGVASFGTPVVVDDGSTDGTAERAAAAGATVRRHDRTSGYDAALRTGFAWASGEGFDAVASIDADAQHDPSLLAELLLPLDSGQVRMVLGVRPRGARAAERLFNFYTRIRFGVPDILCGMKAFGIDVYRGRAEAMSGETIGTGLALAALRDGVPFTLTNVAIGEREGPTRFGRGMRANARIARAMAAGIAADVRRSKAGSRPDHRR